MILPRMVGIMASTMAVRMATMEGIIMEAMEGTMVATATPAFFSKKTSRTPVARPAKRVHRCLARQTLFSECKGSSFFTKVY